VPRGRGDVVKVNLVVASRDVRVDEVTNDLDILGVITEAVPQALPGYLPLVNLTLFCEADVTEVGQERLIEISLLYADGELQQRWYDSYAVPPPPRPGERSFSAPIFPLRSVPFKRPGNYAFSVDVDGDHKNSLPFYVHEPPEASEPEQGES
jgi:hypothetical protein